jgi:hypothetical protein
MAGKLIGGELEYFVAVKAKSGDSTAFKKLWETYKPVMIGMLKSCWWLMNDEKTSESAMIFVHKLELFDSSKVKKDPADWTFSYMLTGGMKNLRIHLRNCFRKVTKAEGVFIEFDATDYFDDPLLPSYPVLHKAPESLIEKNRYDYCEKNNPEFLAVRDAVSLDIKEKVLKRRLSDFQKSVLEFRRANLIITEIADRMGCSCSKVKANIRKAKEIASGIFGINYVKV